MSQGWESTDGAGAAEGIEVGYPQERLARWGDLRRSGACRLAWRDELPGCERQPTWGVR